MDRNRLKRWVLIVYVAATTALLLAPVRSPVVTPSGTDKVAHGLLTGVLAVLVWWVVPHPTRRRALWSAAAAVVYATAIEIVQGFTTWRTTEFADVVAGAVGVVLAVAVIWVVTRPGRG
jgi:VanZ family protein